MDETWQMRSTFKTDGDKESFEHCKLILGPKMAYFLPQNFVFGLFWDNWRYRYTFTISKMDRTWHTRSTFRAGEDKNGFKHSWLILRPKMAHFCPKNCDVGCFWDKWGHFYTFLISKMDETWHTSSTFKPNKDKNSFWHSDSFWGQNWPIFASKLRFWLILR